MTFSRRTFIAAADFAERLTNAEITRMFQRLGYHEPHVPTNKKDRLSNFLADGPLANAIGRFDDSIDRNFIAAVAENLPNRRRLAHDEIADVFLATLKADGFDLADGRLVPAVPVLVEDEEPLERLDHLLRYFGFEEAASHRHQALDAFTDRNWAAANAQCRTFLLALVRALSQKLGDTNCEDDKAARDYLAGLMPPFLDPAVREWDPSGKNTFLHGVFSRLSEDGAHPGLSTGNEAAFRLRLVEIIALDWLDRLVERLG
jgi:hypothetical protein